LAIFDGYRRLSRKRCEIGRWLLWNVNRKSWVLNTCSTAPPGTIQARLEIFGTTEQLPLSTLSTFPGKSVALAVWQGAHRDALMRTPSLAATTAAASTTQRQRDSTNRKHLWTRPSNSGTSAAGCLRTRPQIGTRIRYQ